MLDDGRVVFANTYASEIGVWDRQAGRTSTYAYTGGGPNACMLGTDGNVYITQTARRSATWVAPTTQRPPSIQRATPNGKVEIVVTEADGMKFDGPNDLTFGPDGRLYFTDSGDWDPATKPHPGRIFVIEKNGTAHILEELDHVYPNGIVAEPDGSIVWVESYTLRVVRRRPDGRKKVIYTIPGGPHPRRLQDRRQRQFLDHDGHLRRRRRRLARTASTSISSRPAARTAQLRLRQAARSSGCDMGAVRHQRRRAMSGRLLEGRCRRRRHAALPRRDRLRTAS